jgi:hypothetical protein
MSLPLKRGLRAAAIFIVIVVVAGWPHRGLRAAATEVFSSLANPILAELRFGELKGTAQLRPAPVVDVRRPGEHVTSDAVLALGVEGYEEEMPFGVNLRREFYLPLVIFSAAVIAAPFSLRRRAMAFALGFPLALVLCLGSLYVTICWLFAYQAPRIFPLSPGMLTLLDTVVGTFLMPTATRFIVPLLIAIGMLAVVRARDAAARP